MKKNIYNFFHNRINLLIVINLVLLIILALSFIPKTEKQIFYTSLLKENQISEVQEIILSIPDNSLPPVFSEIKLRKEKNNFVLIADEGKYIVPPELMERFFTALTLKNTFVFQSDSPKQFKNFRLDKNSAISMKLIRNDKSILAEFIFGKKDTLGTGRFVRIDSRTRIFRMRDTLSSFLTLQRSYWLDLQIYKRLFVQNKIQSIEKDAEHIMRNKTNDDFFKELESFLKGFSCIDIFPAKNVSSISSESFSIFLGNGDKIKIEFTPMDSGDYILYDSKLKNAFVISSYSKNRIFNILEKLF